MNLNFDTKSTKILSASKKVPSVHEEPIEGGGSEREVCDICGKRFKTHSMLDRHKENEHGNPEKTHTGPHRVE